MEQVTVGMEVKNRAWVNVDVEVPFEQMWMWRYPLSKCGGIGKDKVAAKGKVVWLGARFPFIPTVNCFFPKCIEAQHDKSIQNLQENRT